MIQKLVEQLNRVADLLDETDVMLDAVKEAYASGEINDKDLDALAGATWGHLIPIIMGDDFIPL